MSTPRTHYLTCRLTNLLAAGSHAPSYALISWICCTAGTGPVPGDAPPLSDRCGAAVD